MKEENYRSAVECYTKAIDLDLRNAVYYCNRYLQPHHQHHFARCNIWHIDIYIYRERDFCWPIQHVQAQGNKAVIYRCVCVCRAAAHSKMGNYTEATCDCERAIGIDPTYSKAYGRMG